MTARRFPLLALVALLVLAPGIAEAHRVIASVFRGGDSIEGEIGFSSGAMAENVLVEVFDGDGNRIGETRTDDTGFFVFTPTEPVDHVFRADLGAGHVAEVTFPAEDLPPGLIESAGTAEAEATPSEDTGAAAAAAPAAALTETQLALVAEAVREEMRPLRREIAAYREHNDLQTILGGIGYIVGIFGIAFFLVARNRYGKG